jgi:hypothetical protein
MRHSATFRTFGYWGVASPALAWNLFLSTSMAQARASVARKPSAASVFNPVAGNGATAPSPVKHLRCTDPDFLKTWTPRKKNESGAPGIMLDYRVSYPASLNTKAAWGATSNPNVEILPSPFGGNRPGLDYSNNAPDTFLSLTGPNLPQDTGFALHLFLYQPPSEMKAAAWTRRWGNAPLGTGWQLRLVDGRAAIVKLSKTWTETKERQLWALWEIAANDLATESQRDTARASADTLEADIYSHETGLGGKLGYGAPVEIVVLPEGDTFSVFLDGERTQVEASHEDDFGLSDEQIAARPRLWHAANTIIALSAGAFFWQEGFPEFYASGELHLSSVVGTWESKADLPLADIDARFLAVAPTGTSISLSRRPIQNAQGEDTENVSLVAVLSTTNRRISPVAFSCALLLKGGPRDGATALSFDSSACPQDPILDVSPGCDGEHRRRQVQIYLRLAAGQTLDAATHDLANGYEYLEHRMATLDVDGAPYLSNGLITSVRIVDAKSMLPNVVRTAIEKGCTVAQITLCDGWARCREKRTKEEVGDERYRGEYLRLLLGNVGFTALELANISNTAGGKLPKARAGDGWKVRAPKGQRYDEWLSTFLKQFCRGWILFQNAAGVWTFERKSKAVKAAFSSSGSRNNRDHYPGRYVMLRKLEKVREAGDFANVHTLTGGTDPRTGDPISRSWRDLASIHAGLGGGNNRPKNFVGRDIEADPIEDETIESVGQANARLRFEVEAMGAPSFPSFPTYFHTAGAGGFNPMPGDYITCDGVLCEILRIPEGSLAGDTMSLGVQEAPGKSSE